MQSVQTERYVDTAAEKLIKTMSRQGARRQKHVRQQNGVETVSRQRKNFKRVPR
jgi:chemotaxis receptor (MCP) glutamine deamidase CheD